MDRYHQHMIPLDDELEELWKSELFTYQETRMILQTRKDMANKISGVSKSVQNFKDYIQSERCVLMKLQSRKCRNPFDDRMKIEYKVVKRIRQLYELAMQRFSQDYSLCLSYFKFCKQLNLLDLATNVIQKMIKDFGYRIDVYQLATSWIAYERNDQRSALDILHKGLTIHKNSQALYTEAIKLELSAVQNTDSRETEKERQLKEIVCEKIKNYIKPISEKINDYNYLIATLILLEDYPFTTKVQEVIINELLEKYFDKKVVWHTLAQREKRGLHYGPSSNLSPLELCFAKYDEGLTRVAGHEKNSLYSLYLDCLIANQKRKDGTPSIDQILKNVLEQAYEEQYLTEHYFMVWAQLSDKPHLILEKGTHALPDSEILWKVRLRTAMEREDKQIKQIFEEGVAELKHRALSLYFMCIRYYNLLCRDEEIEDIYVRGIRASPEISGILKSKYVEWLAFIKGINEAREMYRTLANEKPYSKELHVTMSRIESVEKDYNFIEWERVHELACKQFGGEDVDVWINCVIFYLHYYQKNRTDNVQRIYDEAVKALAPMPFLKSDFEEKFHNAVANPFEYL